VSRRRRTVCGFEVRPGRPRCPMGLLHALGRAADALDRLAGLSVREAALLTSHPFAGILGVALSDIAQSLHPLCRLRQPAVRDRVTSASPVSEEAVDNHLMTSVFGSSWRRQPHGSAPNPTEAAEPSAPRPSNASAAPLGAEVVGPQ